MAITKPTANLFHDNRRKLKGTDKYPVKLTVYYLGDKRRYNLPYHLTKDEWQRINGQKLRDTDLKEIKTKLDFYIGKKFEDCLKIIEEPFSFEKFEDAYFEKHQLVAKNNDVYVAYQKSIDEKNVAGKVGNATIYSTAKKSLENFKKKLSFSDVTPEFLEGYEKQMLVAGRKMAYIAMNLRTLRAIYNQAIGQGIVTQESYPFSTKMNDNKYKIKKGRNVKKALSNDQLKLLKNYQAKTPAQQKALDFWLFSFYCNGLNIKDICLLQYKNIIGNQIIFLRAKTVHSTISSLTIRFAIIPEILEIINRYGNPVKLPENFIFNILPKGIDAKKERDMVQSFTRNINKHMKNVSSDLEFPTSISTYWARHSFSTYLKREGVSIEVISEALGHSSIETTQNYLDTFTDETIEKTGKLLSQI